MTDYINSEFLPEAAQYEAALLALYREYDEVERLITTGDDDEALEQADVRLKNLHVDAQMARAALAVVLNKAGYHTEDAEEWIGGFMLEVQRKAK